MNEKEDYFRILKNGDTHILSNRISFNWKGILISLFSTFILMSIITNNWFIATYVGILNGFFYFLYRFTSWVYYTEIRICETNGRMIQVKKRLNHIRSTQLITDNFNHEQFEYAEINRSGEKKFLLSYKTHKQLDLLILKNEVDKKLIEDYLNKIVFLN